MREDGEPAMGQMRKPRSEQMFSASPPEGDVGHLFQRHRCWRRLDRRWLRCGKKIREEQARRESLLQVRRARGRAGLGGGFLSLPLQRVGSPCANA